MTTQQPQWKCIGHIGDVDPIAHGGAFIYIDETGVYPPKMTWFEPGTDEQWHELEGKTPLDVYRVMLEEDSTREWWYDKLGSIASFTGQTLEQVQADANSADPRVKAWVYDSLVRYFGAEEFDSYPLRMTEDEAYEQYATE